MDVLALAAAVGTALLVGAGTPTTPAPAPVPCDGVAVVVDGGALDSAVLDVGAPDGVTPGVVSALGCADVDVAVSAHDAATAAGVGLEGTQQWGASFVCRVDGRPAVDEQVRRADGSVGTEPCLRTPSQGAYWALWTSSEGSSWVYADRGVTLLDVAPGDAVGLVFVTSDRPEPPRVAPADALAGLVPTGWRASSPSVPTGAPSGHASKQLDGVAAGADAGGADATEDDAAEEAAREGSGVADGSESTGTVTLVGLGLAAGLLVLAGTRARARRP